ncbi:MAG: DUF1330 domain-containing protein [Rhodospirillaceae bacterium]|nr:DUF1330 domain-containing protein [Rhodospirillaceae bacterium]
MNHLAKVVAGLAALAVPGAVHAQASAACDGPGHMLIMGGTEDPAKVSPEALERNKGYGPAVQALIAEYGARYIVRGRVAHVVEGAWPAWKGVVTSTWRCRQDGQAFWHSDKYQNDVKPLRRGASTYRVAMFGPPVKNKAETGQWTAEGGPSARGVACDAPIYLLVTATARDPDKLAAYRRALSESGLMFAYGAVDVLFGPPAEVLEGDWPENFSAKLTRFPCRAAFEAFYASADYTTRFKPMRDGAADFDVVLVDAVK